MNSLLHRIQILEETVRRLSNRIQHSIKPGRQVEDSNESGVAQGLRVKHNSKDMRDIPSMQYYGFASSTLAGCDHLTIQVSGDSSNGFAVASNDQRFRPQSLNAGSSCIYNNFNSRILLDSTNISINANGVLTITVPTINIVGNVNVTGNITATGDIKSQTVSLHGHTHPENGTGGGTTGSPNI